MKSIAFLFALSAAVLPAAARAGHDSPLHSAACEYRDAVKEFQCAVRDVRFIDPCDVRLVDRLEQAACEMHSVSRYPDRIDRVLCQWNDVKLLHRRVAAAIFGRSCYPQHPVLIKSWDRVSCAFRALATQVECVCNVRDVYRPSFGGSGIAFGLPPARFPNTAIPRTFPGQAIPRATIPGRSSPGMTLPREFAPTVPYGDTRLRPEIAPPNPVAPPTDEIRYFGRRPTDYRPSGRHGVDTHFTGNDLRSAMIGALLSRLAY